MGMLRVNNRTTKVSFLALAYSIIWTSEEGRQTMRGCLFETSAHAPASTVLLSHAQACNGALGEKSLKRPLHLPSTSPRKTTTAHGKLHAMTAIAILCLTIRAFSVRFAPMDVHDKALTPIVIPCTVRGCFQHASELSPRWCEEIKAARFELIYVTVKPIKLPPSICPMRNLHVRVPEESPPVRKELAWMQAFKKAPGFVVKMDADVLVIPSRLRSALDGMDPRDENLYAGRPTRSCECTGGNNCRGFMRDGVFFRPRAMQYCTGWPFVTTGAALASSRRNAMRPLLNETAGGSTECHSSDMMVGQIMGMECTPLGSPGAPSGVSWQRRQPGNRRVEIRHGLCNEAGVPGGFSHPTKQSRPDFFKSGDEKCMAFHPLKSSIDRKYIAASVLRQPEPPLPCTVFIGVVSQHSDYAGRQAIRLTWGWLARHIGMCVHFLVEKKRGCLTHRNQTLHTSSPRATPHVVATTSFGATGLRPEPVSLFRQTSTTTCARTPCSG